MTGPSGRGRWTIAQLALLLSPFVAGAAAINLFLLSLMGQPLGLPVLSPMTSVAGGAALALPLSPLAGRWVRRLMDRAEPPAG